MECGIPILTISPGVLLYLACGMWVTNLDAPVYWYSLIVVLFLVCCFILLVGRGNFFSELIYLVCSQNPKQSAARAEGSTIKPTVKRVKPAIGQNHSKVLRWKPKAPGWVNRGRKGSVYLDHIGGFPLKQVGEGHLAHGNQRLFIGFR